MWEVGAVVLGYVGHVAAWRRAATPDYAKRYQPMLIISMSSSTDEGVHEPAASVTVQSREGLLALRQAIDEALKEVVEVTS
jgi:type IV pilus biogenesis protein CpaD/CtpE